jgi:phenylacetate-CoA ligase
MYNKNIIHKQIEAEQLERLKHTAELVYTTVPFYQMAFDAAGIKPHKIKSLLDARSLPFTTKADLRNNYPYGMLAVPLDNVVRIHASSGTTGKPTVTAYTGGDISAWNMLIMRSLETAGVTNKDVFHNAYGYGLFTGGLGFHGGATLRGCAVVPMSGGSTQKQVMLMKDFGATVLGCTPSYALQIAEVAEAEGINLRDLPLRIGMLGGEPWSEEMREQIEERLGISAFDNYGLSEVMGPGVAVECPEKDGLHIWEDHFYAEIVDPDTGDVMAEGEEGELVLTTLTKSASPLIRYRTGDITSFKAGPCRCGRTHRRINRITGRTDDMLIIRGINVYPSQLESVILRTTGINPFYQIEVQREGNLDTLTINVEAGTELTTAGREAMDAIGAKVKRDIKDFVGITCKVNVKRIGDVQRTDGKAIRVIDKR